MYIQMKKKIAIQGVAGCYHDAAAREYFNEDSIETIPCDTFADLFSNLNTDASLLGIIAIENTIAGSLLQNHELLRQSNQTIVGEYKKHISHVLAALPGQAMEEISEVNSHPMALMQCEQFLQRHANMKMVEKNDTAGSAKEISEHKLMGHAAICGEYAAQIYGLEVLEKDIQTIKRNFTRFLILADPIVANEMTKGVNINKASLVFTLPHSQGSLSKVLTIFSFYGINLTKIQSLPILGREWEYRFYICLTFDDYTRYRQSIDAVRPLINDFKILGEYEECKFEN